MFFYAISFPCNLLFHALIKDLIHLIYILFGDHQRRYDTQNITSCRDHKQTFFQSFLHHIPYRAALDHNSLHKAHTSAACSTFMLLNKCIQF